MYLTSCNTELLKHINANLNIQICLPNCMRRNLLYLSFRYFPKIAIVGCIKLCCNLNAWKRMASVQLQLPPIMLRAQLRSRIWPNATKCQPSALILYDKLCQCDPKLGKMPVRNTNSWVNYAASAVFSGIISWK